jgi:AcrR family transcriptional regulator
VTKSEKTRQHIIQSTAPLFNTRGYDGTTLSDMMEATGLTKGALYGNFTDKEEIAYEAFRYSIGRVREMVRARLENVPTYKEQLFALCDFYAGYVFDPPVTGGCPLLNTAVEADDYRLSMKKVVTEELMRTVNFINDLLERGIAAGEFKPGTDTRQLAYTFFCSIEGAIMFSRVERSREPIDLIVAHCKSILNTISNS